MQSIRDQVGQLFRQKAKFAVSGLVATSLDYVLYLVLVGHVFGPVVANICAYSAAVLVNFSLQRRFVFELKGSASRVFLLAMLVSLVGLALNTLIVWSLSQSSWFEARQYVTKAIATGFIFFYNFYLKRYVFERRFA